MDQAFHAFFQLREGTVGQNFGDLRGLQTSPG